ncbi:hypothetical protein K5V07_13470 [Flavobacterium sp. CHNK8]|uniref:hypothetical protein n=1 Tax=Flavobacterium sp. CHNK8 TaxID=2871165 RepID=UPI001C8CFC06|nr:hypothetical protein [Flavobacterium sp. CHNK8]QZK91451.1 hypothetical protein K5V07_13470 [Flavobacterium sp. CHNK8]
MKKLLFTALAVVAFSGAAIAKTGEVKEEYATSDVLYTEQGDDCQEFAADFIDEYDANHVGEEMDALTANNVYQVLLEVCYTDMMG